MTLREFIIAHPEPILAEWVRFARSLGVGAGMSRLSLLNHSAELLVAIAADMAVRQDPAQRAAKAEGRADTNTAVGGIEEVSMYHAISRVDSGFDLLQVVAEYRALRSSVLELWRGCNPRQDEGDVEDIVRFNEAIDEATAVAIRAFTARVRRSSDLFLAVLGHDMRGPLHSISMLAQLASTEFGDRRQLGESTAEIVATVDGASRLLDDLLTFTSTRLGAGLPITRTLVDVAAMCREVIAEMRRTHARSRFAFRCSAPEEEAGTLAGEFDPGRLRQAIANLVRNAVQHGADAGEVTVSLGCGLSTLLLTVHNFGTPIDPELIPTIFEPLVRGQGMSAAAARRVGSVGLGLYIVREVVAAHGGTVSVASTAELGTTFRVELPLRPAPSAEPPGST